MAGGEVKVEPGNSRVLKRQTSSGRKVFPTNVQTFPVAEKQETSDNSGLKALEEPGGAESKWHEIPEALLLKIMDKAAKSQSGWVGKQAMYAISEVCTSWRSIAAATLHEDLWRSSPYITHPLQLFALCPEGAKKGLVKCCIFREEIQDGSGALQQRFKLYLCHDSEPGKFLMSAVQKGRNVKMLYLSKGGEGLPCAKILSNMLNTQHRLLKCGNICYCSCPPSLGKVVPDNVPALGVIRYKLGVKGMISPRRLTAWLPNATAPRDAHKCHSHCQKPHVGNGILHVHKEAWTKDQHNLETQPVETLFSPVRKGACRDHHPAKPPKNCRPRAKLVNKHPHWNENLRCWCLNFRGRVKLASVKNFQLMSRNDASDRIVMQFGKADDNNFIMDYNPTVISAVQAFGIALTSFDNGVRIGGTGYP